MAGYNLKEGKLIREHMDQDEFWNILKKVFSSKIRTTTTYKYCLFKSILDNIFNCDRNFKLTFDQLFDTAAEIYWNQVFVFEIRQCISSKGMKASKIETVINETVEKYKIETGTRYEFLKETIQSELKRRVKTEMSRYVLGALFENTNSRFYEFSIADAYVKIHPNVYDYLIRHKYLVEKLNYYEWLRFLEKVNPIESSYALANKIDTSNKRSGLKKYRSFLLDTYRQDKCFYCGSKLGRGKIHVDHFIPWSYMKSDSLWNLVLSCNTCNLKKGDKLPVYKFLEDLIIRNDNIKIMSNNDLVKVDFFSYNKDKLKRVFGAASNNGLDTGWGA